MHHAKEPPVPILNPTPGGSRYTSGKRARNFVGRGYAVMEGAALRFLPIAEIAAARAAVRAATGEQDHRAWHWYARQPRPGQMQVAQMTARAAPAAQGQPRTRRVSPGRAGGPWLIPSYRPPGPGLSLTAGWQQA